MPVQLTEGRAWTTKACAMLLLADTASYSSTGQSIEEEGRTDRQRERESEGGKDEEASDAWMD